MPNTPQTPENEPVAVSAVDAGSAPTYAQDAADLLARWRNGEDVQDLMAHKLRHLAAGVATLQGHCERKAQIILDTMRERDKYLALLKRIVRNPENAGRDTLLAADVLRATVSAEEIARDEAADTEAERRAEEYHAEHHRPTGNSFFG